jgi:hypothetical protein
MLEEWVCWTSLGQLGVSDDGGVQDLACEQIVKETVKKKISPQLKPMATQGPSLYNELRGKIGRGLELPAIGKNLFIDLAEKNCQRTKCLKFLDMQRCLHE